LYDKNIVGFSLPFLVGCFVCCVSIFVMIINLLMGADARDNRGHQGRDDSATEFSWDIFRATAYVLVSLYISLWFQQNVYHVPLFLVTPWCALVVRHYVQTLGLRCYIIIV